MATDAVTTEATTDARQKAMDEATTDSLDDVSPPMSPELEREESPEYRADIGPGKWKAPPSPWKQGDKIYLRLKEGRLAGPYHIVFSHEPKDQKDKWRYDISDHKTVRRYISGSLLV